MSERQGNRRLLTAMAALLALLVVVLFWPGTSAPFLLDDRVNLDGLARLGGTITLEGLRQFVFGGVSSQLGRPVALLTFAVNGQDWPTEPFPFIVTNILIHAVSAVLLFAVVYKLCGLLRCSMREARLIAFIAALLWAVHPIQIATVLYVVQRMTELATLFSLLAVWCYLHGRQQLQQTPGPAYWWMSGGLVLFGGLAVLSKENAALLPMLLLVLEFTLLRQLPRPAHWRHWAALFLWLPSVLIIGLLVYHGLHHDQTYLIRDFTMVERVLTQARVVVDYLVYMLLPLDTPAIYHERFPLSTGLLSPFTTLLSILFLAVLLVAGVLLRKRLPMLSFAILWFFVGHLLESTVINLELYFLHRNYLPMAGFVIAIAYYLVTWRGAVWRKLAPFAIVPVIWMGATLYYSWVWGDDLRRAKAWATEQTDSYRAQMNYAGRLFYNKQPEQAMAYLAEMRQRYPDFLGAEAFQVVFACALDQLTQQQFVDLVNDANKKPFDNSVGPAMKRLFDYIYEGACTQIKPKGLLLLLQALVENPSLKNMKDDLANVYNIRGMIYFKEKDLRAMDEFYQAYHYRPAFDTAFRLASLYASLGAEREARLYATMAKMFETKRRLFVPSRVNEVDEMLEKYFPSSASVQPNSSTSGS